MEPDKHAKTVHLMINILKLHRCVCEQLVGKLGVHHSQHRLLMNLARRQGGAPSQKELAHEFEVSSAAMATMLKKQEAAGYIKRVPSNGDMRRNCIEITEKGREVVEKSREIFRSIDKRMFDGFTDAQIDEFYSCLDRIQNNMTREEKREK